MVTVLAPPLSLTLLSCSRATNADLLAQWVQFLSSTESRNKLYRVIQYGAKITKWSLMQVWRIERADLQGTLARVESLFADARKVYRFLQFLEMMEMFRNVHETARNVLMLRKLRIICFFFFYLLENYMVFLVRIEGFAARHPRVKLLKRSCNGFWCLSILLAFPLDHIMNRGSYLSTIKKILDLPVAYVAFSDQRVSDGIFGALGLASGSIGVYLRWIDVMAKWWPRPVHRTIQ
uniref:Peroxisomal membrane protein PEX16 n=1 Tax=Globisporangium ultimum (strain ATCC 200006 / CBS 805.95 / DAOM BR144) TaxID=431595 RepID=K3X054_GLOUD